MNPFEMVVTIIVVIMVGKVIQARFKAQQDAAPSREETAHTARMQDEIRALKERVAVLERVITDNEGSLRLDREIERLRDSSNA